LGAVILGSVELVGVFAGFGLSMTATKHVAEFREKDRELAGRILALSTVTASVTGALIAAALFATAPWLAAHSLSARHLTQPLRISAVLLFFLSLTGAQTGALYGFEAFKTNARLQATVAVLSAPLTVAGYFVAGLRGILWGTVIARFAECVLRQMAVRAEARRAHISLRYRKCTRELHVLWEFSLPAVLSGALVIPMNWACSAILVNHPDGYKEMGIYNAASQWSNALLLLPVTLGTVLLPLLSDRIGKRDITESAGILSFMLRFNAVVVSPCVISMSLASPYLMRMYGREYSHAWLTLILLAVTAGVLAVLMPVGDVIAASGRMWLGLLMNAGWAIVLVPSTALLVHYGLGSVGLALARLLSYSIHAVWTFMFAHRVMREHN
jgi:O-antigen/teichoic acid export membrane protein